MSVQGRHQEQEHYIASSLGLTHPSRPPSAPPPYSYPPTSPDGPGAQTESHQLPLGGPPVHFSAISHGASKSPRRPLPPLPEPRIDTSHLASDVPLVASGSRSSLHVSTSPSSSLKILKPSSSFAPSSSSPSLPSSLPPPLTLDTSHSSLSLPGPSSTRSTKRNSFMPLFSRLRSSKTRSPTKQIAAREVQSATHEVPPRAEEVRRAAELERGNRVAAEERARVAATQADAKEAIRSNIRSLLSRHLPSDEYKPILRNCAQICENGDLELSAVLQEPLIDGKPPIYWAILNGPSMQGGDADFDALVVGLVDACTPLENATITSIRLACMLTSNNDLLQHLFRHFPSLSPLSPGEVILLSSVGGGDVVDVEETQDGTGTFVARIQVRRFRLRMRVSKLIKVEFVTSGEPTTCIFVRVAAKLTRHRSDLDHHILCTPRKRFK
jgi:hypothetical protein